MSFSAIFLSYPISVLFFTQVFIVRSSSTATTTTTSATTTPTTVQLNEFVVDQGKNLSLSCNAKGSIMWVKEQRNEESVWNTQENGTLLIANVTVKDSGIYICSVASSGINLDDNNTTDISSKINNITNVNAAETYTEYLRIKVRVRTPPGPVSFLTVRASTIIAVLIWEYPPKKIIAYNVKSFTAEFRRLPGPEQVPEKWERLDPMNISPNIRQLEVYHLEPNTSYEFRIWANNHLGPGQKSTVTATTLSQWEEKDLIRLIMVDARNFDTRIWIIAVGVVMGTLLILALGVCIVLYKECHDSPAIEEDIMDSLELVPNIILNPGFCDSDDQGQLFSPFTRSLSLPYQRTNTVDDDDDDDDDGSYDYEPVSFSRKLSIFFTEGTIKRL